MSGKPDFIRERHAAFPSVEAPVLSTGLATKCISVSEAKKLWPSKSLFIEQFGVWRPKPEHYAWALEGLELWEHQTDAVLRWVVKCPNEHLRGRLIREWCNRQIQ